MFVKNNVVLSAARKLSHIFFEEFVVEKIDLFRRIIKLQAYFVNVKRIVLNHHSVLSGMEVLHVLRFVFVINDLDLNRNILRLHHIDADA